MKKGQPAVKKPSITTKVGKYNSGRFIKGQVHSSNTLKKISETKKRLHKEGKLFSESHLKSLKEHQWNRGKKGLQVAWNKGKKMPEITGDKHPHWKGGTVYFKVRNKRLRENGGSHTLGEWEILKAQYNWTCPCCKKQIELVKDHIIALANGGSNNIENIQPLCRSCNAKKHTKTIKYEKGSEC